MEQKLWFKAKRYGWGWYPISWEGWAVLLGYVVTLIVIAVRADEELHTYGTGMARTLAAFALLVAALIITCYAHGEKAEWHWGNKK